MMGKEVDLFLPVQLAANYTDGASPWAAVGTHNSGGALSQEPSEEQDRLKEASGGHLFQPPCLQAKPREPCGTPLGWEV